MKSNRVADILIDLAACLQVQIETDKLPGTCVMTPVPGAGFAAEWTGDCETACGAAWVRLGQAYPSTSIGAADLTPGNCNKGTGLDVELGVMRCMDVSEIPSTTESLTDSVKLQTADMLAMLKAIRCCSTLESQDFILGTYNPIGPLGGMVGGSWTIYVHVL